MAKRALLIGINKYQIPGADLRGCANDVHDLSAALIEFCDFQKNDITLLIDGAATRKAMKAAITALVRKARKGDVALLHYSGHGSNVPDTYADEADGRDEILCPTDLDWDEPFRDDWLRSQFDSLPAGVHFTAIMDCCHSGTNTRAILPPDARVKERFLPSPWGIGAAESRRTLPRKISSELRRSPRASRKAKDIVHADLPEMLLTACRDTQTAADAFINDRYNGALTFAIVQAIRHAKGRVTYRTLHQQVCVTLKTKHFEQVPQLEGRSNRLDQQVFEAEAP